MEATYSTAIEAMQAIAAEAYRAIDSDGVVFLDEVEVADIARAGIELCTKEALLDFNLSLAFGKIHGWVTAESSTDECDILDAAVAAVRATPGNDTWDVTPAAGAPAP